MMSPYEEMARLATIAADPYYAAEVRRAGAPLNIAERTRMGALQARGCIISVLEQLELYNLVERDRAEDRKRVSP